MKSTSSLEQAGSSKDEINDMVIHLDVVMESLQEIRVALQSLAYPCI
jgi:hypothetical protein